MNTTPTYEAQKSSEKLEHLPNSMQSATNQPTVTFQLYCGILLGINYNIELHESSMLIKEQFL
jgi:hypothetical protein